MNIYKILTLSLVIFCLNINIAQITELKLIPDDPQNVVSFGFSVAIDENIIVVGAAESNILGPKSGSAVVFKNVSGNWIEDTLLLASDGTSPARFGWTVDVQGDWVFIGADQDPQNGIWAGAVYAFKRNIVSGEWNEYQKIIPGDAQPGDLFGSSVSISGSYVLIGARGADNNIGAAYLYEDSGSSWVQVARLTPQNYVGTDPKFGISVSLDGNYALVGAYYDDTGGNQSGAAYIFYNDGNIWSQQSKLLSSDIHPADNFGYSVSLSDDYAIVGSIKAIHNTYRSGAAYVFQRSDTLWYEQAKLLDSSAVTGIAFGYSVSLSNNYLVIGVSQDNENGGNAGAAYIYKRENSNWFKVTKLLASDGNESDIFGWSVNVYGDKAVVGSPVQDVGGLFCGAVYVYDGFLTDVYETDYSIIENFSLHQNFPNPFNPSTKIRYEIPGQSRNDNMLVTLKVYDALGNEVVTLVKEEKPAGEYEIEFPCHSCESRNLSSGVYFYQLKAGNFIQTKKMLIIK